jgi:hypothetical protein
MIQNGISVDDGGPGGKASDAEMLQLTNLLKEQTEILKLGFNEKFSQALQLDGTQSVDAITGLDALVSTTPTTGTVGGIDRSLASNVYWRNYAQTGVTSTTTTGNILDYLEIGYRACVRNGGMPDFIQAGGNFIDGFRNFMFKSFGRIDYENVSEREIEGGTKIAVLPPDSDHVESGIRRHPNVDGFGDVLDEALLHAQQQNDQAPPDRRAGHDHPQASAPV